MASPNTRVFSKTLSKTDAKKRLAIPTRSVGSLPQFINESHAIKIDLIYGTKTWPIQYTISKNGSNKRPSFTSGWTQFVACNGLKPGDGISLYKQGSFLFRVEVETPVDVGASNQQRPLPSPILSLNHEVGENNLGKRPQQLPRAAGAATDTLYSNFPAKTTQVKNKSDGRLPSGHNSKAVHVLRPNPKEIIRAPSPRVLGAEISAKMADKDKPPYMAKEGRETNLSGRSLAAEGVATAAHGGTSHLDAAGEATCKVTTDHPRLGLDLVPENPGQ
ncbi:hypothetical protein GQ457_17G001510 [Hibiscus cannabinus]